MSDITSIAPYEPVTIQDTTDENRTDLVALLQRQENEIALQNQVIRQFLEHWDSISRAVTCGNLISASITSNLGSNQPIAIGAVSPSSDIVLYYNRATHKLAVYNNFNKKNEAEWLATATQ